jgi:hypothetical protein
MVEATERKLREAQFFLVRLTAESKTAIRNEPEAFDFYLSAFLSAARSVTFALQHEGRTSTTHGSRVGLRVAQQRIRISYSFSPQRNYVQKRGGAEVAFVWEYVPVPLIPTDNRAHPTYGLTWSGPPGTPLPTVGVPVHLFESPSGERDVKPTCQRYVALLAELVRNFVQVHS